MNKKINVLIRNNGTVYVETSGYKGESCVQGVKDLLDNILDIDDNIEHTSDYYESEEGIVGGIKLGL